MKRLFLFANLIVAMSLVGTAVNAQALSAKKIEKEAKKQAKVLVKEGWVTAPGKQSVEMQQLKSLQMQNTYDENFSPKFYMGSGQSVGPNYDAAKFQATELAKIEIAGMISSDIAGIVETNIANQQMDPGQAAAITKSVGAYKSFVAAKLTNIISAVDMYKTDSKTGNATAQIIVFYNKDEAIKAGIQAVRDELMKESQELGKELDKLLQSK